MAAEYSKHQVWQRLYQGRCVKAAQGGYAGFGSPAFGLDSVDGELVNNPNEQQTIDLIRRHHKSGKDRKSTRLNSSHSSVSRMPSSA